MEVIYQRCAGMDISKRDAKVCVREPGARAGTYRKTLSTHGAMHRDIVELGDYLVGEEVSMVVMEATGDYWKPYVRHEALWNRVEVKRLCRWSVAAGW